MNPVDKLLKKDEDREAALRALGSARTALGDAIANYRVAFKTATTIGWSKADLTKAGFPDPVRLPKTSGRTPEAEAGRLTQPLKGHINEQRHSLPHRVRHRHRPHRILDHHAASDAL